MNICRPPELNNICFVFDYEYPWDVRVEKVLDSLSKVCGGIHLVCRNRDRKKTQEQLGRIFIHRLPRFRTQLASNMGNINLFFNPYWLSRMLSVAKRNDCKLIIVRDLPLSLGGILVGMKLGIPVIVDMAEPYPLTLKQRLRCEPVWPHHLITRNFILAELLEYLTIRYSRHVFVVCEEAKRRLLKKGAKSSMITIIRNTPRIDGNHSHASFVPPSPKRQKDKFTITYVGLLIGGRGLELTLRAIKRMGQESNDIRLVVVGSGKKEGTLRSLAAKIGINDVVTFEGWVAHEKVWDYIRASDLGILPFRPTEHMRHTVANKLFDFWAMGKPVLCSDLAPMRRHIIESGAGYLFEAGSEKSLSRAILECKYDSQISEKGERGRQMIEEKYNWSKDEVALLKIVRMLGGMRTKQDCHAATK